MGDNVNIDVRNLACPEPLLRVKKTLNGVTSETLKHAHYEVIGNSVSAEENISRFLKKEGYAFEVGQSNDKKQFMIIIKAKLEAQKTQELSNKILPKTLLVRSDKIGEGELGVMLINAFLKALTNTQVLPQRIFFLNRGVLLTTDNGEVQNDEIVEALKELEKLGVQVYSCGSCLSYFALTERVKVGMIGNALEAIEEMLKGEGVISL